MCLLRAKFYSTETGLKESFEGYEGFLLVEANIISIFVQQRAIGMRLVQDFEVR